MPAERLGALLRAARKRRGLNRKQAAAHVAETAVPSPGASFPGRNPSPGAGFTGPRPSAVPRPAPHF